MKLNRNGLRRIGTSRFAAPVALAMTLLVLVVNETGYRSAQHFDSVGSDAAQARLAVVQLRRLLVDAESAQRGYLITSRPEYQQPYLRARDELQSKLVELRRALGADQPHAAAVRRLEKAAVERISELEEVTRLFDAGHKERAITLVLTDIGREKMIDVEEAVEQIERDTLAAFVDHQRQLQRTLRWSHFGIAALALFSLAVVWLTLWQSRRGEQERAAQQAALQAERDKLEAEVSARTAELTELATHLQTVRENERGRLARELHDELGGLMTAAKLDVARMRSKLGAVPPDVSERLAHLLQTLDAGIALKRRIIEDLQPSALRNLGLAAALQGLCEEFSQTSEIEVAVRVDADQIDAARPDEQRALTIYRLVQEALTNAGKHARARHIGVALRLDGGQLHVAVTDDGHGFEPAAGGRAGHGLTGMRFRVRQAGGTMQVRSAPGAGTIIEASLPLAA